MVIKNVELETVCGVTSMLPDNKLPEVAFAANPMSANRHRSMR